MSWWIFLVAAVALVIACTVVAVALSRRRSDVSSEPYAAVAPAPADQPRAAIIVNPTKFNDVDAVRQQVRSACEGHGWTDPLWLETTADDPGTGQARQALEQQVDLVCALGGDGTVRAVAAGMVDSDVPMGLLPGGTGNLLARNLELPIDSLDAALGVALTGRDDRVDVGTVNVLVPGDTQDDDADHIFLVMAGMGFDASVMADAPEKLKAQFGWPAYVVSAVKHLAGHRFDLEVSIDDGPLQRRRVRTVVIGNVGRLQGGVELLPDAEHDDGTLDVVMLSPKGAVGWASVAAYIGTGQRRGHPRIEHRRCRSMLLRLKGTQEVQLDGDAIGPGHVLRVGVKPRSLVVRIP